MPVADMSGMPVAQIPVFPAATTSSADMRGIPAVMRPPLLATQDVVPPVSSAPTYIADDRPGFVRGDPYFKYVTALLLFNEANNGSTVIRNLAGRGGQWVIGSAGGGALSTISPNFGNGCLNLPQSGGISRVDSTDADNAVGLGDYTIEFSYWVAANQDVYMFDINNSGATIRFVPSTGTNGQGYVEALGALLVGRSVNAVNVLNAWNHVAWGRTNGQVFYFFNGRFINQNSNASDMSGTTITIGCRFDGGFPSTCRIGYFRLTKGLCRYNTTYALPGQAFPVY